MVKRPLPKFIQKMRKEEPSNKIVERLIDCYKSGGIEFEDNVRSMVGNIANKRLAISDVKTRQMLEWRYVGDHWWCRYIDRPGILGKYEFARLMAILGNEIVGLWDDRKHAFIPPAVLVNRGGREGAIVGYNEFEVFVMWSNDGIAEPVQDVSSLEFKYVEDYRKYSKIRKR